MCFKASGVVLEMQYYSDGMCDHAQEDQAHQLLQYFVEPAGLSNSKKKRTLMWIGEYLRDNEYNERKCRHNMKDQG